jgi:hypothetical protein
MPFTIWMASVSFIGKLEVSFLVRLFVSRNLSQPAMNITHSEAAIRYKIFFFIMLRD